MLVLYELAVALLVYKKYLMMFSLPVPLYPINHYAKPCRGTIVGRCCRVVSLVSRSA